MSDNNKPVGISCKGCVVEKSCMSASESSRCDQYRSDPKRRERVDPDLVNRFQDMTDALMAIDRFPVDSVIEHSIDGIVTEAGELADASKRVKWYGTTLDKVNVLEECGDLLFYLDKLIRGCGSTLNEVIEINMKKLGTRYANHKFSKEQAVDRDTDKEREVLEHVADLIGGDVLLKSKKIADESKVLKTCGNCQRGGKKSCPYKGTKVKPVICPKHKYAGSIIEFESPVNTTKTATQLVDEGQALECHNCLLEDTCLKTILERRGCTTFTEKI